MPSWMSPFSYSLSMAMSMGMAEGVECANGRVFVRGRER